MSIEGRIAEIACAAHGMDELRARVLRAAREALQADVALLATKVPRDGVRIAREGFGLGVAAALDAGWDRYGVEIEPVRARALRDGVATDLGTLGAALRRKSVYREVMAPRGGTESLLVVPQLAGRPLGMLLLGRCGGRFSRAALEVARGIGPTLALACAAVDARGDDTSPALDLSPTEHELLRYLELGYTTREIATARGTSFFTVRNQLSTLYRKLDVTNRTEAVGLFRRR